MTKEELLKDIDFWRGRVKFWEQSKDFWKERVITIKKNDLERLEGVLEAYVKVSILFIKAKDIVVEYERRLKEEEVE